MRRCLLGLAALHLMGCGCGDDDDIAPDGDADADADGVPFDPCGGRNFVCNRPCP